MAPTRSSMPTMNPGVTAAAHYAPTHLDEDAESSPVITSPLSTKTKSAQAFRPRKRVNAWLLVRWGAGHGAPDYRSVTSSFLGSSFLRWPALMGVGKLPSSPTDDHRDAEPQ